MRIVALSLLFFLFQYEPKINFIPNDVPKGIHTAASENKVCVVEFYASWCLPCQIMENSTWPQEQVINFFSENCVLVKVDIDDSFGSDFAQKYDIKRIPVILILDENAKEIGRLENSASASKLIEFVTPYVPAKETNAPVVEAPAPIPTINQGELVTVPEPPAVIPSKKTPPTKPEPTTASGKDSGIIPPAKKPVGNYKPIPETKPNYRNNGPKSDIASAKKPVSGPKTTKEAPPVIKSVRTELKNANFTVQIGAYAQAENAQSAREKFAKQFKKPSAILEPSHSLEDGLYRVFLGSFKTRKEAEAFKSKLVKTGVHGIIREV